MFTKINFRIISHHIWAPKKFVKFFFGHLSLTPDWSEVISKKKYQIAPPYSWWILKKTLRCAITEMGYWQWTGFLQNLLTSAKINHFTKNLLKWMISWNILQAYEIKGNYHLELKFFKYFLLLQKVCKGQSSQMQFYNLIQYAEQLSNNFYIKCLFTYQLTL